MRCILLSLQPCTTNTTKLRARVNKHKWKVWLHTSSAVESKRFIHPAFFSESVTILWVVGNLWEKAVSPLYQCSTTRFSVLFSCFALWNVTSYFCKWTGCVTKGALSAVLRSKENWEQDISEDLSGFLLPRQRYHDWLFESDMQEAGLSITNVHKT